MAIINNPLTGQIDSAQISPSGDGGAIIKIQGWILCASTPTKSLSIELSPKLPIEIISLARPDVAQKLPNVPHADQSGYCAVIPVVDQELRSINAKFILELIDGQILTSEAVIDPRPQVTEKLPGTNDYESVYGSKQSRENLIRDNSNKLAIYLREKQRIVFKPQDTPVMSVVLVLYNRAEMTLACLRSLESQQDDVALEVIIIDNASTDATPSLLQSIDGVVVQTNIQNVHFVHGANQGAYKAKGDYILFLNNDTKLSPGALKNALAAITSSPTYGAVGGLIIRPDGKLQEAGSLIFSDGSSCGIGRGEEPWDRRFSLRRKVDYVSGAFLLTKRSLFLQCGMFDSQYAPAYYEDADYCIKLAKLGYQIICEPRCSIIHCEKSSSSFESAEQLILKNKPKFFAAHGEYLRSRLKAVTNKPIITGKKILLVDDFIPLADRGQGLPRASLILKTLSQLGYQVTLAILNEHQNPRPGTVPEEFSQTEIVKFAARGAFIEFMLRRGKSFDTFFISRPNNMELFQLAITCEGLIRSDARIIYDSEAIFAERQIRQAEVLNNLLLDETERASIESIELEIGRASDKIFAISKSNADKFLSYGYNQVDILGFATSTRTDTPGFESRAKILTVGPMLTEDSPNSDGVLWFLLNVIPNLRALLTDEALALTAAGDCLAPVLKNMRSTYFNALGKVANLTPLYDAHRIFIAPTRYSAGISIKVIEAAANGIPVVATPLVAAQLGWTDGVELMVGYSAEDFAVKCKVLLSNPERWQSIREAALRRVSFDFSLEKFTAVLARGLAPQV